MANDYDTSILPQTEPPRSSSDLSENPRKELPPPQEKRVSSYDGSADERKWALRETGADYEERPRSNWLSQHAPSRKVRRVLWDMFMIIAILAFWIPAVINDRPQVRHRIIPSSIISWFFILLILFHKSRYIPQKPFVRVIRATWNTVLGKPWGMLPYKMKLGVGWLSFVVLIFGTTYGLPTTPTSTYVQRTISLAGLVMIYGGLFIFSSNHSAISARTTILGIGFQFIIALFVFRTGAGLAIFQWLANAAGDLLNQAVVGGAAFFWGDLIEQHYFFINTLASIIFFVALCIALFYVGALTWIIRKMAWFFHKTFGVSGAEAVVAVASPFIGQGENVVLVRPYARLFTRSEFHQVLTSGFATISGSVLGAYILLGVNGRDLITSSVMSIPAAIAASKMIVPETQEAETAGAVSIAREESEEDKSNDVLHALSNGAWFGVRVAALVFCNVLVIVSVVYAINGILAYIGNAWWITADNHGPLSLELILGYILWPLAFMLGTPKEDCLQVAKLISIKVIQNEFVAYTTYKSEIEALISPRAQKIVTYALCGFGNLGSLGINIGVMSAIAPKRKVDIVKLAPSALITGIFVTLSSAAIAGIVSSE